MFQHKSRWTSQSDSLAFITPLSTSISVGVRPSAKVSTAFVSPVLTHRSQPQSSESYARYNGVVVEDVQNWCAEKKEIGQEVVNVSSSFVGCGAPFVNGDVLLQQYHVQRHKSGAPGKLSLQAARLAVNSPYLSPVSPNDAGALFHEPTSLSTKSPTMMLIPSPLGSATNSSSSSSSSPAVPFSSSVISNTPMTPSTSLLLHTPPNLSMSSTELGKAVGVSDAFGKLEGVGFREGVIKRLDSPSIRGCSYTSRCAARAITTSSSPSATSHSAAPDYTVISPHKLALRKHMEEEEEKKQRLLSAPLLPQAPVDVGSRKRQSSVEDDLGVIGDAWITASSNQRRNCNLPIEKNSEAHHLPAKLVHKMTNHSAQQKTSSATVASSCVNSSASGPSIAQSQNMTLGGQMDQIIEAEYGLLNGNLQQHQSRHQQSLQPPKKTRRRSGKSASPSSSSSGHAVGRGTLSLNSSSQDHRGLGVSWATSTKIASSTAASTYFDGSQRYSPEGVGLKLHIPYQFKTDQVPRVVNGARIDAGDGRVSSSPRLANSVVTTTATSFFSPIYTRHDSKPPSTLTATLFAAPKTDFSQLPTLPSGYLSLSSPTSSIITSPALSLSSGHLVSSSFASITPRSQHNQIAAASRPFSNPSNPPTSHGPPSHSLTSKTFSTQTSLFHPPTTIIPYRKLHVRNSASSSTSHASTSSSSSLASNHSRLVNGSSTPSPPCTSYRGSIPPSSCIHSATTPLSSAAASQLRSVSTNIPSMSAINGTVRNKNSQIVVANGFKPVGNRKSPVTTPP